VNRINPASYLILVFIACCLLISCQAVGPILTDAAVKFGQDVLTSSAENYSPKYASELEQLFIALVKQQTGLELTPKLADQNDQYSGDYGYTGTNQDPYSYDGSAQQDPYAYGSNTQDPYGNGGSTRQDPYAYGGNIQDPYGNGGSARQDPYPYGGNTQDPYGNGGSAWQDPYAYGSNTQDPYGNGGSARQDPYDYGGSTQAINQPQYSSSRTPVSMDVGLLAQRIHSDGSVTLEAIGDGAVLYDGRGDARAGDKLKITFKANCECYVYIIGIDATGYVAQIFPDPDSASGNPVQRDRQYTLPAGDVWWGLDEYRGIETIYFVASQTRRRDIEDVVTKMAGTKRRVPNDYQPVQKAAVIPQTRGLVKVQAAPATTVTTESGSTYAVTPTAFTSAVSGVDLVITRWFSHQ
jgi:hypothetical protein